MGIFDFFTAGYDGKTILILVVAWLCAILFAVVIHEFAHSFVANKMGDNTPKLAGRLTLNPAKHFDGIGFFFLLIFGFGWAKPVPINSNNFRNIRKGEALVSIAGITANLICFVLFSLLFVVCASFLDSSVLVLKFIIILMQYLAFVNLVFALFNILPIFPLDGYNLLSAFLRPDNRFLLFMRMYGMWILIALMLTGVFALGISWVANWLFNNLVYLFSYLFI